MLNFYNKKIYLDFEIFDTYDTKAIMLCDNPYVSKPLPNEIHYQSLYIDDLLKSPYKDVFMNLNQFNAFIREWIDNSNLFVCIDYNEWVEDYLNCIKQLSNIMGNDYDYTDRNSLFRQRQRWIIDNIDINNINDEIQSPIIFSNNVEPEYSFKVADTLKCLKSNILSMYQKDLDKIIEINKCKCIEYQNKANILGCNYLDFKTFNNYKSLDDLCYLYFPLSGESINSNFIYIKKCLENYLEK